MKSLVTRRLPLKLALLGFRLIARFAKKLSIRFPSLTSNYRIEYGSGVP